MQRNALLGATALAFAAAISLAPAASFAADAAHPYRNIDKKVDAGNDTGDAQVDALNAAQLDENQHPAAGIASPPPAAPQYMQNGIGMPMSPAHPPMMAAPAGQ